MSIKFLYNHYSGILLSNKEKQITDTLTKLEESKNTLSKRSRINRGHTICFHLYTVLESANSSTTLENRGVSGCLGKDQEKERIKLKRSIRKHEVEWIYSLF